VALQKLPVVFCIDRAGIVGEDGVTHQGVFDLSYLQFIPNLTIVAPSTDKELCDTMEWSQSWEDGPVAIRYPRGIATEGGRRNSEFGIGKADVWFEGTEIAISGVGHSFWVAKELYEMILKDYPEVKPYLINPLFIKPYDKAVYDKIYDKCKYHIVIEENAQIGGFASRLSLDYNLSDCKTVPFSIPDMFIEHGAPDLLRDLLGLNAEKIYNVVARLALANTKE
jgi:1-deoxy-D-xylulose-5-phosphate synthase